VFCCVSFSCDCVVCDSLRVFCVKSDDSHVFVKTRGRVCEDDCRDSDMWVFCLTGVQRHEGACVSP